MRNTVISLLRERGILLCAPLPIAQCRITRPYLLERAGITDGTVFVFAVPYYTTLHDDISRNISAYAVSRDYHLFFSQLFDDLLPLLQDAFPKNRFAGFSDHSPISEAEAAVKAGLGVFGKNHLFLTKEHSSFVFLGELITDAVLPCEAKELSLCTDCGACLHACPVGLDVSRCLSALTQKKGTLSEEECDAIRKGGSLWGCDRCQEVCPVTKAARDAGTLYSNVPFFAEATLPHLDSDTLFSMSDEEFSKRAFAWRGRAVIARNIELLEKEDLR